MVPARRILVEFVGAAGVGKSFLAAILIDALVRRGVPAVDIERTRIKKASLRTVRTVAAAAFVALRLRPRSLSSYLAAAKRLAQFKLRQAAAPRGDGVIVSDEGIFHRMRAFRRNARSLDMIQIADRVLMHVTAPDFVVVVEASPQRILAQRLVRIGRSRAFSAASVENDVLLLAESIRTIEHVQRDAHPALHMLRIHIEHDVASAAIEGLADILETRFSEPRDSAR